MEYSDDLGVDEAISVEVANEFEDFARCRYARSYLDLRLGDDHWDRDALAVLRLGALINLRRSRWTFEKAPLGLDDDRAIATWFDMALAILNPQRPLEK